MRLGDLGRLFHIQRVLFRLSVAYSRAHRRGDERAMPVHVREALEELGPTFVKLGQMLSVRPDLVPAPYVTEFERLRSNVPSFPAAEVRRAIEGDLRQSVESLFPVFDWVPLAAASIAQVHMAVTVDGERVAVKVRRPGIERQIEQDIRLLRAVSRQIERLVPGMRPVRVTALIDEFAAWTRRELDFRIEGTNADHFRANFADDPHVCVPRIHWDLTTARVLTMEFIDAVPLENPERLARLGIDPEHIARVGARVLFRAVFVHGFFHGDPHPGNLFALPCDRICYQDFGIVGYLTGNLRIEVTAFFIAFLRGDLEAAISHVRHMATPLPDADPARLERDLLDVLTAWQYTGRQSTARTFLKVLRAGAAANYAFPSALALLAKALITVETVGFELAPDFDIRRELRPFIHELYLEWLNPKRLRDRLESNALDYARAAQDIPLRLADTLAAFADGEVNVGIDPGEWADLRREMHHVGQIWSLSLLLAFFGVVTLIAVQSADATDVAPGVLAVVGTIGMVIVGLWLAVRMTRR